MCYMFTCWKVSPEISGVSVACHTVYFLDLKGDSGM